VSELAAKLAQFPAGMRLNASIDDTARAEHAEDLEKINAAAASAGLRLEY
jgi:hypothetical protein